MGDERILGTGIDLVENERMQEILRRWGPKFRDRVFLGGEREYCETKADPCGHYAGRFAVKEAVSKAFGTGFGPHMGWLDIEVVRDPVTGAPSVRLSRRARTLARARGVRQILISLSHTRNYAIAQALLIGGAEDEADRT
jgi:holo-[acyl-carrier protein] synthase